MKGSPENLERTNSKETKDHFFVPFPSVNEVGTGPMSASGTPGLWAEVSLGALMSAKFRMEISGSEVYARGHPWLPKERLTSELLVLFAVLTLGWPSGSGVGPGEGWEEVNETAERKRDRVTLVAVDGSEAGSGDWDGR